MCTVIILISVKQIKRRTLAAKQCLLMIENIEMFLNYQNATIYEIIHTLYNTGLYSELSFLSVIESDINNNFSDSVCNEKTLLCIDSLNVLDGKDKENLKYFLSMLGKSDLNGQVMNCRFYKEYFKNKSKNYEDNEAEKCKSVSTIIIGIGLLIAIIIA